MKELRNERMKELRNERIKELRNEIRLLFCRNLKLMTN